MTWNLKQKSRQLLADEIGAITKPHGVKLRVALAFPNTYRLGMSNLGFQAVYRLFNDIPEVVCERVFLPEPTDIIEHRRTSTPLFSLESQSPLREFDVVAFSLTFEPDSVNVLEMLDLAGIALESSERGEGEPIVIAGGPVATINPEPLSRFVDAFAIGEGEELVGEIARRLIPDHDLPRAERIRSLATIEGIYVPALYTVDYNADGTISGFRAEPGAPERVHKRVSRNLDKLDTISNILTPHTEFGNIRLVEVARGCKRGCRFCVAGHAYRPARFRSASAIMRAVLGFEVEEKPRIGLVGSSVSDNPEIETVCRELREHGIRFTASSLRAESLGAGLARELAHGGQLTATIAPEAATERLRRVIGKPIPESEFARAIAELVAAGIRRVKLYYMIGLPTETDEDAAAIPELSLKLWRGSGLERLTVAATPFVPKPFTPFQWHSMEDRRVLERRIEGIRSALRRVKHVKFSFESPRESVVQAVLARGDRRTGATILACHKNGGNWARAFREARIDPNFYAQRQRGQHEILPWEIVDLGLSRERLWREGRSQLPPAKPEA